jgi:hypothetical protein
MSFVAVGPLTSLLETAAAAVGAGILLGGFAMGLRGTALAWSVPRLEARAVEGGYIGGGFGGAAMIADITIRYLF